MDEREHLLGASSSGQGLSVGQSPQHPQQQVQQQQHPGPRGGALASLGTLLSSLGSSLGQGSAADDAAGSNGRVELRITSGGRAGPRQEATGVAGSTQPQQQQQQPQRHTLALLRHLSRSGSRHEAGQEGGGGGPDANANVASSAERHRLSNTAVVDLQACVVPRATGT